MIKYVYTSTCIDPYIYAYMHICTYMCIYTFICNYSEEKKETTNLKETQEGYMQGFEKWERKGKMKVQ